MSTNYLCLLIRRTWDLAVRYCKNRSLQSEITRLIQPVVWPVVSEWPEGPARDALEQAIDKAKRLRLRGADIDLSALDADQSDNIADYFRRTHYREWRATGDKPTWLRVPTAGELSQEAWSTLDDLRYIHDDRYPALRAV